MRRLLARITLLALLAACAPREGAEPPGTISGTFTHRGPDGMTSLIFRPDGRVQSVGSGQGGGFAGDMQYGVIGDTVFLYLPDSGGAPSAAMRGAGVFRVVIAGDSLRFVDPTMATLAPVYRRAR